MLLLQQTSHFHIALATLASPHWKSNIRTYGKKTQRFKKSFNHFLDSASCVKKSCLILISYCHFKGASHWFYRWTSVYSRKYYSACENACIMQLWRTFVKSKKMTLMMSFKCHQGYLSDNRKLDWRRGVWNTVCWHLAGTESRMRQISQIEVHYGKRDW